MPASTKSPVDCVAAWRKSKLEKLAAELTHYPELLRCRDVMAITGWSVRAYLRNCADIRIAVLGYKERRVPKVLLLQKLELTVR